MLEKINRKQPGLVKIIKHAIFPALFYFLAFCLLTYPLILAFFTHFYADKGDGLQNIWNLWWVDLAVHRPDLHPTIWYTNLLHWPAGVTLFGQTLNPFNGYLTVFLHKFLSLTATYNTIIIFSFVMGGVSMYWFTYTLTKSFWGSLMGGFIFTFSSYHFMHAQGQLQLASLEWLPLFILCWYWLLTKPHPVIAVGTAIVLWLVILCDYYYFFYCVLTAGFIFIWYAIINKDAWFSVRKKHFLSLATFAVVAILLTEPIAGALLKSSQMDALLGVHDPARNSLNLLSLFIPGEYWLFSQWTQTFWSKITGINENSVYLGIPVFVLLGYVWIKRKTLELPIKQQIYLWSVIIGFFFLLALGPALEIGGSIIWKKAMPYTLMVKAIPFLGLSGVPVRMVVMVVFGASVLSAIGFGELFRRFSQTKIFTLLLIVLLLFETLQKPQPATRIVVPGYITALAGLPSNGGVLDLVTTGLSLPLYYQTIHGKPITGGYVSRIPTSVYDQDGAISELVKDQNYGKLWGTYHIGYIITHGSLQAQAAEPYITVEPVYDLNDIRIYRIGCECEGGK
ncbi:MAG: hypothetical protein WCE68_08820 [Anaerolineales bacterium]